MPQIEIPFTPGQRVRTDGGYEFAVDWVALEGVGTFHIYNDEGSAWDASCLTLVEPVIEWRRDDRWEGWRGEDWTAYDDGILSWKDTHVGIFDNPRAIAEATQKMWNEARKG